MKHPAISKSILLSLILFLTVPSLAQTGSLRIPVNWFAIEQDPGLRNTFYKQSRITRETFISFEVNHFNYLRYNLEHEVEQEVIVSYRVLEDLWNQLFNQIPLGIAALPDSVKAKDEFLFYLDQWRTWLNLRDRALDAFLEAFPTNVGLPQGVLDDLMDRIEDPGVQHGAIGVGAVAQLQALKIQARDKILTSKSFTTAVFNPVAIKDDDDHLIGRTDTLQGVIVSAQGATDAYYAGKLYEQQLQVHDAVLAKFDAFFEKGRDTYRGKEIRVGKKSQGTLVTTTFTVDNFNAADYSIAAQQLPVSVQYFVQSTRPVMFHAGYVISSLDDIDFEKVQTLAGNEVFNLIRDDDLSQDMSAFLTWEFLNSNDGSASLGVSIGTEIKSPGDQVILGLSARFLRRWLLTVATANSGILEGVNEISGNGDIRAFESIKKSREWGILVGISVTPF